MSNKKTWVLFFVFFVLSFSLISINFEHDTNSVSDREKEVDIIIQDFLVKHVSDMQLNANKPYLWKGDLSYSIEHYDHLSEFKQNSELVELFLRRLSIVTGFELVRVEPLKSKIRIIFSKDWRRTLIEKYPSLREFTKANENLSEQDYLNYWMQKEQSQYTFRALNNQTNQIQSAWVFFNEKLKDDNCEISIGIARILMLTPEITTLITNTCRTNQLPHLEEKFLEVYYSEMFKEFLFKNPGSNKKEIINFIKKQMIVSLKNESK